MSRADAGAQWFRPGLSMAMVAFLTLAATLLIHLFATPDLALGDLLVHAALIAGAYSAGFIFVYLPIARFWLAVRPQRAPPVWLLVLVALLGMVAGFLILKAAELLGLGGPGGGHADEAWIVRLLPVALVIIALFLASERSRQLRLELARLGRQAAGAPLPRSRSAAIELQAGRTASMVSLDDIAIVAAQENYCQVTLASGQRLLIRSTLAEMLDRLPARLFVRTHRSFVASLDRIVRIEPSGRAYRAFLRDGDQSVPVSRNYVEDVAQSWRALNAARDGG